MARPKKTVEAPEINPFDIPELGTMPAVTEGDNLFAAVPAGDFRTNRRVKESEIVVNDTKIEDLTANHQPLNARAFVGEPKPSIAVTGDLLTGMLRAEELAAEIVRTKGRYIEAVDNAKPGVTFTGGMAHQTVAPDLPMKVVNQEVFIRSDGNILDMGILDTGDGAQERIVGDTTFDENDPASPDFAVCVNRSCDYRATCARYRISPDRKNKAIFYPDECRISGVYISIDDTKFTAYVPMKVIESTSTPSF